MKKTSELFQPDWIVWDRLIAQNGITINRPIGSAHPVHEDIIYPIDYGYVNETVGTDGEEVDIFVGTASNGLVGAILSTDFRKDDRECKLIFNCTRDEVYLINGFINFDQELMMGRLVLRFKLIDIHG